MNVQGETRSGTRRYEMRRRADSAANTRRRILLAMLELHVERYHDQITLEDVAERAATTVQTVLRHFGSREHLIDAAAELATAMVVSERSEAPVGDVQGAVDNLIDHYEAWGPTALKLLFQEDRVPQLGTVAATGRALHHEWVDHTFAPFLEETSDRQLRPKLIALTDVFMWKLLRVDLGLDRSATESALVGMIESVIREGRAP